VSLFKNANDRGLTTLHRIDVRTAHSVDGKPRWLVGILLGALIVFDPALSMVTTRSQSVEIRRLRLVGYRCNSMGVVFAFLPPRRSRIRPLMAADVC
jgi:hypothetical protein